MKARYVLAALTVLAVPASSEAQIKVDLNNVTCGDWLGYSHDQRSQYISRFHDRPLAPSTLA